MYLVAILKWLARKTNQGVDDVVIAIVGIIGILTIGALSILFLVWFYSTIGWLWDFVLEAGFWNSFLTYLTGIYVTLGFVIGYDIRDWWPYFFFWKTDTLLLKFNSPNQQIDFEKWMADRAIKFHMGIVDKNHYFYQIQNHEKYYFYDKNDAIMVRLKFHDIIIEPVKETVDK